MPGPARGFFRLITAWHGADVFNPWTDHDPATDVGADAPAQRLRRLRRHLATEARVILVGEAAGYQGCHVSGIAFTSERLILEGAIPRVTAPGSRSSTRARLSTRPRPWSEPSATTVWGTLRELGLAEQTILWNAFPWHPHRPGNRQTNRTPTRSERAEGLQLLHSLLDSFPRATVFAVGRHAESSLAALSVPHRYLRHPSMAGASAFRAGLVAGVRRR